MPDKIRPSPKYRRIPYQRKLRRPNPLLGRPGRNQSPRALSRSASEPILHTAPFDVNSTETTATIPNQNRHDVSFPRPHTFTDGGFFSSSSSLLPSSPPAAPNYLEEAKVVVSVTVEGSPGPVRALVKLGATVDEAIGVVVDNYKREGRSPKLNWDKKEDCCCLELHHSHFSLQSLNKTDKIGELGSRSFYLRKSDGNNSFNSASEGNSARGSEIELFDGRIQMVPPAPTQLLFSFIVKKLSKIRRRTIKLWRLLTCIT